MSGRPILGVFVDLKEWRLTMSCSLGDTVRILSGTHALAGTTPASGAAVQLMEWVHSDLRRFNCNRKRRGRNGILCLQEAE
jgi:hypothetical protein